jgi:hypothetical protein
MKGHPICLGCYRHGISMTDDPPHDPLWPVEQCRLCRRQTNHGIYVDIAVLRVASKRIGAEGP